MGGSQSSNYVDEAVNVMTSVAISATQVCQNEFIDIQSFNLQGVNCSDLKFGNITDKTSISLNTQCSQTDNIKSSVCIAVSEAAKQVSESISSFLSLSDADASDMAVATENLATQIALKFNQTCFSKLTVNQTFNLTDVNHSTIIFGNIDFETDANEVVNCVQADSAVNSVKETLKIKIEQKAVAIELGILGPLLLIIVAVVIIIVIVVIGGGAKEASSGNIIGIIIGILLIYIAIAYFEGWFPFKHKPDLSIKKGLKDIEGLL